MRLWSVPRSPVFLISTQIYILITGDWFVLILIKHVVYIFCIYKNCGFSQIKIENNQTNKKEKENCDLSTHYCNTMTENSCFENGQNLINMVLIITVCDCIQYTVVVKISPLSIRGCFRFLYTLYVYFSILYIIFLISYEYLFSNNKLLIISLNIKHQIQLPLYR